MVERGISIDHVTIWRWVQCYAPILNQRLRRELRRPNRSWRVDETYVKVAGKWAYLYRAVDSAGHTIDFLLSPKRDLIAAKLFLRLALSGTGGIRPRVINVDGHPAYARAIAELKRTGDLGRRCRCRPSRYFIRKRITASLSFQSVECAWRTIEGYEAMHTIRKGPDPVAGQRRRDGTAPIHPHSFRHGCAALAGIHWTRIDSRLYLQQIPPAVRDGGRICVSIAGREGRCEFVEGE